MAYVSNEENPNLQPPVGQQAPVAAGGAGVGGGTKSAATPGVNVPAQPSAQLSAYLGANQPQANAMAGNIAGNLSGQVAAAGNAIQPAANAYTSNLYSVPTNANLNAKVASSPSSLTAEEQAAYKNQLGAAGKAPNPTGTFETTQPYQDLTSGIQKTVENANLWNSGNNPSAISAAMAPYESPNATGGVRTLDSLLLSQSPGAYGQIQKAVAPAADLSGKLSAATDTSNAALRDAISKDQAATTAATAGGQQYATGLSKTLQDYLTQAQADTNTYNSAVNGISTKEADLQPLIAGLQDAIAAYNANVAQEQSGNAAGVFAPLSSILSGQPGALPSSVLPPELSALASSKDYSDIAALNQLFQDAGVSAPTLPLDSKTASQAGSYQSPTGSIPGISDILAQMMTAAKMGIADNFSAISGDSLLGSGSATGNAANQQVQAVVDAYNALASKAGMDQYSSDAGSWVNNPSTHDDGVMRPPENKPTDNTPPNSTPPGTPKKPGIYRPI